MCLRRNRRTRKALLDQFAALQKARGGKDYDERVLSFYASLDPAADAWFVQSIQKDVSALHDKALARAQDLLLRAQSHCGSNIARAARLAARSGSKSGISAGFRSEAQSAVECAVRRATGHAHLYAAESGSSRRLRPPACGYRSRSDLQRRSLTELRMVLDPGLLKAKLALIGGEQSEARQSP